MRGGVETGSQRPLANRVVTGGQNNPIHIKIEDQNGIFNNAVGSKTGSYTMATVSPNPHNNKK